MMNAQGKLFRSAMIIAVALGFGAGCGGTVEEPLEPAQDQELATQEATVEEPRKIDDLIAALDEDSSILYTVDSSTDTALAQLKATRLDSTRYQATNPLNGEKLIFTVRPSPAQQFISFFKLCSNGQWVFNWVTCPTLVFETKSLQVWINSSCSWHVQVPNWSSCTNLLTGGSYNYQYLDAWKCGVGRGICVNWRAVKTIRYDYALAACNPNFIQNITPYSNYYCQ